MHFSNKLWLFFLLVSLAPHSLLAIRTNDSEQLEELMQSCTDGNLKSVLKSKKRIDKKILKKFFEKKTQYVFYTNISEQDYELLELLVKQGVNIDARNEDNETLLMRSVRFPEHIRYTKLLIELGAHLEEKTKEGHTALTIAAFCNSREAAKALVKAGAKLTAIDNKRNNILHLATKYYWEIEIEDIIEILQEENALKELINKKNLKGETPLYIAVKHKYYELIDLILEAGADPKVRYHFKAPYQFLDKYSTDKEERQYYKKLKKMARQ